MRSLGSYLVVNPGFVAGSVRDDIRRAERSGDRGLVYPLADGALYHTERELALLGRRQRLGVLGRGWLLGWYAAG